MVYSDIPPTPVFGCHSEIHAIVNRVWRAYVHLLPRHGLWKFHLVFLLAVTANFHFRCLFFVQVLQRYRRKCLSSMQRSCFLETRIGAFLSKYLRSLIYAHLIYDRCHRPTCVNVLLQHLVNSHVTRFIVSLLGTDFRRMTAFGPCFLDHFW